MLLSELLELVDQKWWKEFLTFVETGEASEEFLAVLDTDDKCQSAVEMALQVQAAGVERAAKTLRLDHLLASGFANQPVPAQSRRMAEALEAVVDTPAAERAEVVRQAVAVVKHSIDPAQANVLRSVVDDLEKELASA